MASPITAVTLLAEESTPAVDLTARTINARISDAPSVGQDSCQVSVVGGVPMGTARRISITIRHSPTTIDTYVFALTEIEYNGATNISSLTGADNEDSDSAASEILALITPASVAAVSSLHKGWDMLLQASTAPVDTNERLSDVIVSKITEPSYDRVIAALSDYSLTVSRSLRGNRILTRVGDRIAGDSALSLSRGDYTAFKARANNAIPLGQSQNARVQYTLRGEEISEGTLGDANGLGTFDSDIKARIRREAYRYNAAQTTLSASLTLVGYRRDVRLGKWIALTDESIGGFSEAIVTARKFVFEDARTETQISLGGFR